MGKKRKIVLGIILLVILAIIGRIIWWDLSMGVVVKHTDYVAMTMDSAIYSSDLIVLAEASGDTKVKIVREKQNNGKWIKSPYEETKFKIDEVYLGEENIQNIVCRDDNAGDSIKFEKGEKAILFLGYDSQKDAYYFVAGSQGICVYDEEKGKYVSGTLEFEDMEKEIERYENTPEEERQIKGR